MRDTTGTGELTILNAELDRWIEATRPGRLSERYLVEIERYRLFSAIRLVFESNLIEKAGMATLGDTRKLVENSGLPLVDATKTHGLPLSGAALEFGGTKQPAYLEYFRRKGVNIERAGRAIVFSGKQRQEREVLQHYLAYLKSVVYTLEFRLARVRKGIWENHPRPVEESLVGVKKPLSPSNICPRKRRLFTEARIRHLHRLLAEGLLAKEDHVAAGEYRIDERHVGFDVLFPAPKSVPGCMKRFVEDSDKRIQMMMQGGADLLSTAAQVSYDFVMIHPFPDFNGRISRLLLAMILWVGGIPFPVTLRGDRKGRHKYHLALRKANRGDLRAYTELVAKRVIESFEELDENILRAGLPSILTL